MTDLAFYCPGCDSDMPVYHTMDSGGWQLAHQWTTPSWASQPGIVAIPGDYDGDSYTDIAFRRPGAWSTLPIIYGHRELGWLCSSNEWAPNWANA